MSVSRLIIFHVKDYLDSLSLRTALTNKHLTWHHAIPSPMGPSRALNFLYFLCYLPSIQRLSRIFKEVRIYD